jgi:hypothetical protein
MATLWINDRASLETSEVLECGDASPLSMSGGAAFRLPTCRIHLSSPQTVTVNFFDIGYGRIRLFCSQSGAVLAG